MVSDDFIAISDVSQMVVCDTQLGNRHSYASGARSVSGFGAVDRDQGRAEVDAAWKQVVPAVPSRDLAASAASCHNVVAIVGGPQ